VKTWGKEAVRTAAGALALVAVASCRQAQVPEIRIGVLGTFTGPYADISGTPTAQGAALAVKVFDTLRINGVLCRVTLVSRDFDDRADAAASAARALINQERVIALIGPQFSRHAIPVAVVAEDSRIPMITPMSSNPAVTAGRRFVFRLAFLDDVQGPVLARFAREDLHARSAAVLYDISTAYSRDLADRFRETFTKNGGTVSAFETYTADRAEDFGPQLQRIARAAPEVLFLPNFPDAIARQVPQLQNARIRATLLGGDSWDPQSLPTLAASQRAFVTNQWRSDLPLPAARDFVARYRAEYHAEPRAAAAMTYDAMQILLAAIARAGTDPDRLRDAIAATHEHAGAAGVVSFDGHADPRRAVAVSRIQPGTIETVRLVEP
jgi:branched-chain amino acid transport system substrate-binding protein